jgi:hypothetical protein
MARIADFLRRACTLDARGLALFRIALGLLLATDAITRLRDVELFYTRLGISPAKSLTLAGVLIRPSLYWLADTTAWATALLLLTALAGLLLAIGLGARSAAAVGWLLAVSVQHRNGLINTGADQVLACALFLAMFLPVGRRLSVDAALGRRRGIPAASDAVFSPAGVALIAQLFLIYIFNVIQKDGAGWRNGLAVLQALHIDHHATWFGIFLREHLAVVSVPLTFATLIVEASVVLLLIPTPWFRLTLAAAFWGLHLGFAACMYLGLFSWLSMALWLAVVPGALFDRLAGRFSWATSLEAAPVLASAPARSRWRYVSVLPLFCLIALQLWVNVASLGGPPVPRVPTMVARFIGSYQAWRMFGDPSRNDGWWVIVGTFDDGHQTDLFQHRTPPVFDKPASVANTYKTARWRKLMMHTAQQSEGAAVRRAHARWYCAHINRERVEADRLIKLEMFFMEEKTRNNFKPHPPKRLDLLTFDCRSNREQARPRPHLLPGSPDQTPDQSPDRTPERTR